jgi:hypothetical protein
MIRKRVHTQEPAFRRGESLVRTVLFFLGAVGFNLAALVFCFVLLGLPYAFLVVPHIEAAWAPYGFIPIFMLAAGLSFFMYAKLLPRFRRTLTGGLGQR